MRSRMIAACLLALAVPAAADELPVLTIRNHQFEPARIEVLADTRFRLWVKNADTTLEEFESFDLDRQEMVPPGREIYLFLGPLAKGEYKFFGGLHLDTAQGVLVAK